MRPLLSLVSGLLVLAAPARAVDYGRIDRTLVKEPAYARGTAAPRYALLLFGREAKVRVWAVLHGEELYLDRNGDGDLTGADEHFAKAADCKGVEIPDPDGKTRYVVTGASVYRDGEPPPRPHLMLSVDIKGPLSYRQYCDVEGRATSRQAAVAHFHGPLTAGPSTVNGKVPPGLRLAVGDKATDLYGLVGTMDAAHGCWVVVRSHNGDRSAFGEGACPEVEVDYPPKAAGGPPVKKRYRLDKFC